MPSGAPRPQGTLQAAISPPARPTNAPQRAARPFRPVGTAASQPREYRRARTALTHILMLGLGRAVRRGEAKGLRRYDMRWESRCPRTIRAGMTKKSPPAPTQHTHTLEPADCHEETSTTAMRPTHHTTLYHPCDYISHRAFHHNHVYADSQSLLGPRMRSGAARCHWLNLKRIRGRLPDVLFGRQRRCTQVGDAGGRSARVQRVRPGSAVWARAVSAGCGAEARGRVGLRGGVLWSPDLPEPRKS